MLFRVLSDKIIGDILGKAYREKRRKKRFHELLLYAFDNSKFYRDLYESHGIKREDLNDVYGGAPQSLDQYKSILKSNLN